MIKESLALLALQGERAECLRQRAEKSSRGHWNDAKDIEKYMNGTLEPAITKLRDKLTIHVHGTY